MSYNLIARFEICVQDIGRGRVFFAHVRGCAPPRLPIDAVETWEFPRDTPPS